MAVTQIHVDVTWREIPLLRDQRIIAVEASGAFLPTASPMPVGTRVIITPVENRELHVPAVVSEIRERLATRQAEAAAARPGMTLVFEADAEGLLEYLVEGSEDDGEAGESGGEVDQGAVVAEEGLSFDLGATPEGVDSSGVSGEYAEIVAIQAPETGDAEQREPSLEEESASEVQREVKDSALAPQASGEIQFVPRAAWDDDPEAPDKVIVDVRDVPRPEITGSPAEADEEEIPDTEAETVVERPIGLRAAEEDDDGESGESGKKRKKRKGKRRKKKR